MFCLTEILFVDINLNKMNNKEDVAGNLRAGRGTVLIWG